MELATDTKLNFLYQPPASQQIYESSPSAKYCGLLIEEYFARRFPYQSKKDWIKKIKNGDILINGLVARTGYVLKVGDRIITYAGLRREPPANRNLKVVYEDFHIRVFDKPAPIPVHPSGRYFQNSMTEILRQWYPKEIPRPVQRLDTTTTGVIIFARTREAAAVLMNEFKGRQIKKEYLALVEGKPEVEQFCIDAPIGILNGSRRGVGHQVKKAKPAKTKIKWLASKNGRSLLRVNPHSGRTNQIRVHLSSCGLPIYNDPVYGYGKEENYLYGLHAWSLEFKLFDKIMKFQVEPPSHFQSLLEIAKDKIK